MGRLPRDREKRGGNKGTRERERERGVEQTVCSLDRIIAGGSGAHLASPRLAANHLDLTFPPTSLPILHLSFVYRSWCSVLSDSDTFLSHPLPFLLFSSLSYFFFFLDPLSTEDPVEKGINIGREETRRDETRAI